MLLSTDMKTVIRVLASRGRSWLVQHSAGRIIMKHHVLLVDSKHQPWPCSSILALPLLIHKQQPMPMLQLRTLKLQPNPQSDTLLWSDLHLWTAARALDSLRPISSTALIPT